MSEKYPPRVWFILQSRCTGKAKAYETREAAWQDIAHNDDEIKVMQVSEHEALIREAIAKTWREVYTQITAENSGDSALDFARIKAYVTNHYEANKEAREIICDYCGEKIPCVNRCHVDMDPSK